ncbi:uncharacterized protein LAESUDRAFT_764553 [Laetiporus sulphureus 93-53]|uniref:Peptidase S64 n=1 Tax=Laetiporus sulphureus 93-53 TaxID=1314785 RepID=A0A165B8F6_9APHY|nr:uncharacterized protein LAESUDRAFT_764553 [Laetiporus sulphureus 93-53]KZT00483.1 hypothetical protein LAESUDRAFT_764553 [Laetiporus sulphureus 93-53]
MFELSEELQAKKIIDFTEAELVEARFMGDGESLGVPESVRYMVQKIKEHPESLGFVTGFMLGCFQTAAPKDGTKAPDSPALSDASNLFTRVSVASDALTLVGSNVMTQFEMANYYHGLLEDDNEIPQPYYRSNMAEAPFALPKAGNPWFKVPVKNVEAVFDEVLTPELWAVVAVDVIAVFKRRGIRYSSLKMARFSTPDEATGKRALGPIVVWIATHPDTTGPAQAQEASPEILDVFKGHGVLGVVAEWYEGTVERLDGPRLMDTVDETNPTYRYRHPYTAALSLPVAPKIKSRDDGQGTVGLFFHENRDKNGQPSPHVLALTNKHVLSADFDADYEFRGAGAPREAAIAVFLKEAARLADEVKRLKAEPKSTDAEKALDDEDALEEKKAALQKMDRRNTRLQVFYKEISTQWKDPELRNIGYTDYAPSISARVDETRYTRDIGTIRLDPRKFEDFFRGNLVDLGDKYASHQLDDLFWPNDTQPASRPKFPTNGLLRIRGVVPPEEMAKPECYDESDNPIFVVGKVGQTTGFRLARFSALNAYTCTLSGVESTEMLFYNLNKSSGDFSAKGDSGSLIFSGDRRMVALLHSGEVKGFNSLVTYGSPMGWVLEQLKVKYPFANFNGETFHIAA